MLKFTAFALALAAIFASALNFTHWALRTHWYSVDESKSYTETPPFYNALLNDQNVLTYYGNYYDNFSLDDVEYAKENYGALKSYLISLEASRTQALEICSQLAVFYASEPPIDEEYSGSVIVTTSPYQNATSESASQTPSSSENNTSVAGETSVTEPASTSAQETTVPAFSSHDSWSRVVQELEDKLENMCGAEKNFNAENINRIYDSLVESETARYINNYNSAKNAAKDRAIDAGVSFAIVDLKTGKIFSNCGLDDCTEQQARDILGSGDWSLAYSSEKGLEHGSFPHETSKIFEMFWTDNNANTLELNIKNSFKQGDNTLLLMCVNPTGITKETGFTGTSKYTLIKENFENYKSDNSNYAASAIVFLGVAILMAIYLIFVTGKRPDGTFKLGEVDKIPVDLHFIFSAVAMFGAGMLIVYLMAETYATNDFATRHMMKYAPVYVSGVFTVIGALFAEWILSFTRSVRAGDGYIYKNTLYFRLIKFIWRICKWFARGVLRLHRRNKRFIKRSVRTIAFSDYKSIKRVALLYAIAYVAINFALFGFLALVIVLRSAFSTFIFFVIICAFNVLALIYLMNFLKCLDEIMNTAASMRNGDFTVEPDIASAPLALKKFASDVVSGRESIKNAVDEALKGERMKAELITNVSHDLKTPLTSIITYMDLLKKCDITDEDALKYIGVLDDKSKRLKRLIEDLTEASKASTGNIKLNKMSVDLYELAIQAVGEHSDALEAMGLEAIIDENASQRPVIYADSQRTWRIIDNLFSNAKKYAMPNTRVYVNVTQEDGFGIFTIKNISRDPLNIPPEELTQRFVRGDESRGSEGSGLGLSIATSLCELQGGSFKIDIDGDLFKATVKLPLYTGQAYNPNPGENPDPAPLQSEPEKAL